MGGQTFGSMAQGVQTGTQGIGALVLYVFALVGVVMAGMGIYDFYSLHNGNGRATIKTAATKTIIGFVLAGSLAYMINSGSMTFGNSGASTQLQQVINP